MADGAPILFSLLVTLFGVCVTFAVVAISVGVSLFVVFKVMKGMSSGGGAIAGGVSAPALVTGVADTGVSLNDNPQVRVTMQVHPADAAPYEASVNTFVSRVQTAQYAPGSLMHVRYDPANPPRVGIVRALGQVEAYGPDGGEAPDVLAAVRGLIASQELTEALAQAPEVPGTVLANHEVGLYCAGRNPLVELMIEVRPAAGEPYTATTTGVLSQLSVGKYGVGKDVFVRADPADPLRIALSRSA